MAENETPNQPLPTEQPRPGVLIVPPNSLPNEPIIATPTSNLEPPTQPVAEPPAPAPVAQQPLSPVSTEETPWAAPIPAEPTTSIAWTASEYIAHHKSPGWYATLAASAVAAAFLVWLLTKDKISAAVVLFGALMLGIYAGRQPRQLEYLIDETGLTIGEKYYPYDSFRSFAVVAEGAFSSIIFMPLKRFAPAISIYYAPQDEAAIVDLLAVRLPSEDLRKDPIDRLMSRIRF